VGARATEGGLEIVVSKIDEEWHPIGERSVLAADALCVGYGFVPANELARLCGCRVRFDELQDAYVPERDELLESSVPGIFVAGEAAGIGGAALAEAEGQIAGTGAAWRAGRLTRNEAAARTAEARRRCARMLAFRGSMNRVYRVRPGLYDIATDETLVCRCEEVPLAAVAHAVDCGDVDVSAVKARTRCGMGLCQGRMCEQNLRPIVARLSRREAQAVGTFSTRPPIKALPLSAFQTGAPRPGAAGQAGAQSS
jgi:NAD(P)H-nitrite reductase large subunit